MRLFLASVLAAHGVAHLVGFVSSWQLARLPELPYKTTLLAGRIDVGDNGMRTIGVLWLLLAVAFVAAAVSVAAAADWAARVMVVAAVVSLMLCMTAWPEARIGVAVNVVLILLLTVGGRLNPAALVP